MTDKGWGCVFALGIYAVASIVLYWIAYYVFGMLDMGENHRVAMSALVGISAALGLNKVLD